MKDFEQLQLMLSVIFGFIGSFALYISTLICGHNIFKELPVRVSVTVAGFIGFLLFIFSPISFIILFPELFIEPHLLKPVNLKILLFEIHQLIKQSIFSFILSAVGLGAVIGALSEIKPRKSILRSINRTFHLYLREFSYDFAWDGFLRGIKKLGIITLVLNGKSITGHLQNYSVASEPKQLILKRCRVHNSPDASDDATGCKIDNLLITELSEIREIIAADNSFKKHYHELNHCSQATYLLLAAVGTVLLAISGELTYTFLLNHKIAYITYMYAGVSCILAITSLLFMWFAARTLKHDFRTFSATAAFYPPLTLCLHF